MRFFHEIVLVIIQDAAAKGRNLPNDLTLFVKIFAQEDGSENTDEKACKYRNATSLFPDQAKKRNRFLVVWVWHIVSSNTAIPFAGLKLKKTFIFL
jgi:hypothetical protein